MDLPNFPGFGWLFQLGGRVWTAIRQNPCTIEKFHDTWDPPYLKFRIRNDSPTAVHIERLEINWKVTGRSDYNINEVAEFLKGDAVPKTYKPGESFDLGVLPGEWDGAKPEGVELKVFHNRSTHPEILRAKVKENAKGQWKWA